VIENAARSLFGHDAEPLLLTGAYVKQCRGYRMRDGSRRGAVVDVHPDPRVQALVEQMREREIEQVAGRPRYVRAEQPGEVILLTNLPTRLAVDRLVTWAEIMPSRLQQAMLKLGGVLPLSGAELHRVCPGSWSTAEAAEHDLKRSGVRGQNPNRDSIWDLACYSTAVLATYRTASAGRFKPLRALITGDGQDVEARLTAALGPVHDVQVREVYRRDEAQAEQPAQPEQPPEQHPPEQRPPEPPPPEPQPWARRPEPQPCAEPVLLMVPLGNGELIGLDEPAASFLIGKRVIQRFVPRHRGLPAWVAAKLAAKVDAHPPPEWPDWAAGDDVPVTTLPSATKDES
jgi:hypothetical protein